jgi:hypothetical protein
MYSLLDPTYGIGCLDVAKSFHSSIEPFNKPVQGHTDQVNGGSQVELVTELTTPDSLCCREGLEYVVKMLFVVSKCLFVLRTIHATRFQLWYHGQSI